MPTPKRRLQAVGACPDSLEWAQNRESFQEIWDACERGDWLLWLWAKAGGDRHEMVGLACRCVRTLSPTERKALTTLEEWASGSITDEEARAQFPVNPDSISKTDIEEVLCFLGLTAYSDEAQEYAPNYLANSIACLCKLSDDEKIALGRCAAIIREYKVNVPELA